MGGGKTVLFVGWVEEKLSNFVKGFYFHFFFFLIPSGFIEFFY